MQIAWLLDVHKPRQNCWPLSCDRLAADGIASRPRPETIQVEIGEMFRNVAVCDLDKANRLRRVIALSSAVAVTQIRAVTADEASPAMHRSLEFFGHFSRKRLPVAQRWLRNNRIVFPRYKDFRRGGEENASRESAANAPHLARPSAGQVAVAVSE